MARLIWGAAGERLFETGVDRGVLYVGSSSGVPWNGLTSVSESVTGGEARPYFLDGIKYLNVAAATEFEATIEAFSSPDEFKVCDGIASMNNGLFATQQPRRPFNFSYRTLVGNDVEGQDYAYKIHLIYNALSAPAERANSTISESQTPMTMSWPITTLPPTTPGMKPTAHLIIDATQTSHMMLEYIEGILYGNESNAPRMPNMAELVSVFGSSMYPLLKAVLMEDGSFYEIHEVDPLDARAVQSPVAPADPASGEEPILWFDTSPGSYAIPKLITGA